MASAFEQILDAVEAAILVADNTVTFGRFRLSESEHDSRHRVVWIPVGGTGGRVETTGTTDYSDGGINYRVTPLGIEELDVEIVVRSASFEATDTLKTTVLRAMRETLKTAMDSSYSFTWETQQEGGASHLHADAQVCTLRVTWSLSIAAEILELTTINTATHAGEFIDTTGAC